MFMMCTSGVWACTPGEHRACGLVANTWRSTVLNERPEGDTCEPVLKLTKSRGRSVSAHEALASWKSEVFALCSTVELTCARSISVSATLAGLAWPGASALPWQQEVW